MEQTNNNFPRFERGQVLTSEALNNYFGYLDEQQRLTRAKLLGVGIIDGLEYEFSGNSLIIKKGTAVTADGYLIDLPEDTTYKLIYEFNKNGNMLAKQNPLSDTVDKDFETVLNKVKYVYYNDESDATKHNLNPTSKASLPDDWKTKYVLALMVDFVSQDEITKCSELSCDILQSNYKTEIRPVLIKKELLGENKLAIYTKTLNYMTPNIPDELSEGSVYLSTIGTIHITGKNYDDFIKALLYQLVDVTSDNIEKVLKQINIFHLISDNIEAKLDSLGTHVTAFKNYKGRIPGYYVHHIQNVETAIEEFMDCFNSFATKYPVIPINSIVFKRIVILGCEKYTSNNDEYRQANDQLLQNPQFIADCSFLEKAFNRIFSFAEKFNFKYESTLSSSSLKNVACYHLKSHAKLEESPRPSYYDSYVERSLYYSGRPETTYKPSDSLVIENYYGMDKYSLDQDLKLYKRLYNVQFTTEFVPVGNVSYSIEKYSKEYGPSYTNEKIEYNLEKVREFFKNYMEIKDIKYSINTILECIDKKEKILASYAKDLIEAIRQNIPYIDLDSYRPLFNAGRFTSSEEANLAYCIQYILQYVEYTPIQIGKCPKNGKLIVFYNYDNDKVLLVLGSNYQPVDSTIYSYYYELKNGLKSK